MIIISTFWVKATGKITNHLILVLEGDYHVSTNIFPSDHILNAKTTEMMVTKSLSKVLCNEDFTRGIN